MSLRCNGSTTTGVSTTTVVNNNDFTACGFVRLTTNQVDFTSIFTIQTSGVGHWFETAADGVTLEYSNGGAGTNTHVTGEALTIGAWYFVALILEGSGTTGKATIFSKHVGAATCRSASTAATVDVSHTVTSIVLGADGSGGATDSFLFGNVAGWRMWVGSKLTPAELDRESESILASRRADLTYEWPLDSDKDLRDRNRGNLLSGTAAQLALGDTPPIAYSPVRRRRAAGPIPGGTFALEEGGASDNYAAMAALSFPDPIWPSAAASSAEEIFLPTFRLTGRAYPSPVGLGGFLLFGLNLQPTIALVEDGTPAQPFDADARAAAPFANAANYDEPIVSLPLEDTTAPAILSVDPTDPPALWGRSGGDEDVPVTAATLASEDAAALTVWLDQAPVSWASLAAEDFAGSLPLEEPSVAVWSWLEPTSIPFAQPTGEDVYGLTVADELGTSVVLFEAVPWPAVGISEDFAGSLPLEEPPGASWSWTDPPAWLSAPPAGEDVRGLTVADEVGTSVALPDAVPWVAFATAEDFAGSLPLEEPSGPVASWLDPAPWLATSVGFGEDVGVTATTIVDEPPFTWAAPDALPWVSFAISSGEDVPTTATGLDDGSGSPAWLSADVPWPAPVPPAEEWTKLQTPVDEPAFAAWTFVDGPPPSSPWLAEDFAGSLPLDEAGAVTIWLAPFDAPIAVSRPEDFAGSLPADETGTSPAWLGGLEWSYGAPASAEDFAGSLPADEGPGATWWLSQEPLAAPVTVSEDAPSPIALAEDGAFAQTAFAALDPWPQPSRTEESAATVALDEGGSTAWIHAWTGTHSTWFAVVVAEDPGAHVATVTVAMTRTLNPTMSVTAPLNPTMDATRALNPERSATAPINPTADGTRTLNPTRGPTRVR